MVAAAFFELPALTQQVDSFIQQRDIQSAFFHELISLFIGCGKFDLVHQSSRAAFKSSILEYPLTSGSREIRRASAIASRVFWLYAGISTAKGSPPRRTHCTGTYLLYWTYPVRAGSKQKTGNCMYPPYLTVSMRQFRDLQWIQTGKRHCVSGRLPVPSAPIRSSGERSSTLTGERCTLVEHDG